MNDYIIPELQKRRARRALREDAVPEEVLDRVFEAATLAPSCSNNQPWRYLVCSAPEVREKAREALSGGNYWARKAPVLVVVTTKDSLDCQLSDDRNYAQFGVGMSAMALMLQATREGLYAHPMAGFSPAKLREAFGIEADVRIITMIAIGYPGDSDELSDKHKESEVSERVRKPMSEVVFRDEWHPI